MDDNDESGMCIPQFVLEEFEKHCAKLKKARDVRRETVALRNVVEDKREREAVSIADTLGKRQPEDNYDGDVNLRTLRLLLRMIDERGWERCVFGPTRSSLCFG